MWREFKLEQFTRTRFVNEHEQLTWQQRGQAVKHEGKIWIHAFLGVFTKRGKLQFISRVMIFRVLDFWYNNEVNL